MTKETSKQVINLKLEAMFENTEHLELDDKIELDEEITLETTTTTTKLFRSSCQNSAFSSRFL